MSKSIMGKNDTNTQLKVDLAAVKEASQNAEERYRLLVESIRDYGIFMLDQDGFITSWNIGAERIKGYSAEEIIGKHFSVFYTTEDIKRQHPQYELEQARSHSRYEEEGWRLRKNGTRFWANVLITALRAKDGKLLGFTKVTKDLTERKQAEEKLRLSEERARRMFEGVKDYAMIMLNADGTVASWNEGARRIKGYEPHEIIGKYFSVFYPESDIQMGKCEYELREAAETGRFEDEGWRIRKDGTRFWASVLITAIRDNDGKVISYSKVTRDITDRKRADDLLKMAYSNLEKRVEERTTQLLKANEQLKEAVQVRDDFLSIASHELRTPLTPLKLQVQGLINNLKRLSLNQIDSDRVNSLAKSCDKSVTRLATLIDNLLDVSRINSGRLVLNYERFDVVELLKENLERYRSETLASGSEIEFVHDEFILGAFDKLRLEQVFLNLFLNALKYGAKKPVLITARVNKGVFELTIKDRGIGIAEHDLERIFERFERLISQESISGLGLGLYITRQIVRAHNGDIKVVSKMTEGSTFTVTLPLN